MSDDRVKPKRIRCSGLQDVQLDALAKLDAACAAMFYAAGFDGAEVPVRAAADFARLTRDHDVLVAEADYVVAGYSAWRDESPGIAYLADLAVAPDFQRFGVGARLIELLHRDAHDKRMEQIIVRCWERATWAMAFYAVQGFVAIDGRAPEKVRAWRAHREASGHPVVRPGEIALWAPVKKPVVEDDDAGSAEEPSAD